MKKFFLNFLNISILAIFLVSCSNQITATSDSEKLEIIAKNIEKIDQKDNAEQEENIDDNEIIIYDTYLTKSIKIEPLKDKNNDVKGYLLSIANNNLFLYSKSMNKIQEIELTEDVLKEIKRIGDTLIDLGDEIRFGIKSDKDILENKNFKLIIGYKLFNFKPKEENNFIFTITEIENKK